VNAGRLRAFAIAGSKRFSGLPDVPTAAEAGLPGFESEFWIGMFAPARTPATIIGRLSHEIVAILRSPEMQASLLTQGAEPSAGTSQAFAAFIESETARLKKVVEVAGIRLK
jgi:tripartite-type tricarboxylate transporter receptor subunit TctC